jgi:hypothetical protein
MVSMLVFEKHHDHLESWPRAFGRDDRANLVRRNMIIARCKILVTCRVVGQLLRVCPLVDALTGPVPARVPSPAGSGPSLLAAVPAWTSKLPQAFLLQRSLKGPADLQILPTCLQHGFRKHWQESLELPSSWLQCGRLEFQPPKTLKP